MTRAWLVSSSQWGAGGAGAAAARLPPPTWSWRSRSIAATSGTTGPIHRNPARRPRWCSTPSPAASACCWCAG
jgi:hypothetical protein